MRDTPKAKSKGRPKIKVVTKIGMTFCWIPEFMKLTLLVALTSQWKKFI